MTMQPSDKRYSPMNIEEQRNLSTKNIKRVENNLNMNPALEKRGISAEKFSILKSTEEQENHSSISKRYFLDKKDLISTTITFKECVNILHYCRLVYKYTTTLRQSSYSDENQVKTFSKWLMKILKEINEKIDSKNIVYEG